MPIDIEIEIKSSITEDELQELCSYVREHVDGVNSAYMKINKPLPGSMGGWAEPIIHAVIGEVAKESYIHFIKTVWEPKLWPAIQKGYNDIRNKGNTDRREELVALAGIKQEKERVYFLESTNGPRQIFDKKFFNIDIENTYAVLIGCGKYENTDVFPEISPIKNNINNLYNIFADKRYVGIPQNQIIVSLDEPEHLIKRKILDASLKENIETLILYYAGHGHRVGERDFYLTTPHAFYYDDPSTIIGAVKFQEIEEGILRRSKAKQKIILLDACHSGVVAQSSDVFVDFQIEGSYVLASSSADKKSYFRPEDNNTFFTAALLESFECGVENTVEKVSLHDLYLHTKKKVELQNLPLPTEKSRLNIPPQNFYISRNGSFSLQMLKERTKCRIAESSLDDALKLTKDLANKFPDEPEFKQLYDFYKTEILYGKLVNEGDDYYYNKKNYREAIKKYELALDTKNIVDSVVKQKIITCRTLIKQDTVPSVEEDNSSFLIGESGEETSRHQAGMMPLGNKISYKKGARKIFTGRVLIPLFFLLISAGIYQFIHRNNDDLNNSMLENDLVAKEYSPLLTADSLFGQYKYMDAKNLYLANKDDLSPTQLLNIAWLYETGRADGKSQIDSSLEYYVKAGELGNREAISWLAVAYGRYGAVKGIDTNHKSAFYWYKKSATLFKDSVAMYSVGVMYHGGYGVQKNIDSAIKWLNLSAINGFIQAKLYISQNDILK